MNSNTILNRTISIKGLIGENCITVEDGQKLYDRIHPQLKANEHVEIDFDGVRICASPFFNFGIGQLLKDLPSSSLNELLKISNLHSVGEKTLRVVIANSKQYYSDNQSVRQSIDAAVMEQEQLNR
jgi:STAS-like domain of unknown function (DUF4325)